MLRCCLLTLAFVVSVIFTGCGGPSKPEPLTGEQERELQKQLEQVQDQERAHSAQQAPGTGGPGR